MNSYYEEFKDKTKILLERDNDMDNETIYQHGYAELEETPQIGYDQIDFFGKNLNTDTIPYNKVVNNGYVILTKDTYLLKDLDWNEKYKNGIVDWNAFKVGRTVLFATNDRAYGCSLADHYNRTIELNEIVDEKFYEELNP